MKDKTFLRRVKPTICCSGDRLETSDPSDRAGISQQSHPRLSPPPPGALGGHHEGRGGQDHGRDDTLATS